MKLKDLVLISTSALVMGAFAPSAVQINHAFGSPNVVYAQELTEAELETVAEIKNNLAGLQPVNLEQLLNVSDLDLLNYYETALVEAPDNQWKFIYDQVATDYPGLNLLTGEEYDAYLRAAEAISAHSESYNYTFSDLNTALPRDILAWYQAAMSENEDDVAATVAQILPQITAARDAYIVRRTEREQQEAIESEETSPESEESEETTEVSEDESESESEALTELDRLKASLVEYTYITAEGLSLIDDAVLEGYLPQAQESNFDEASALAIRDMLVSDYPELFTAEQIEGVAATIRQGLINETPILPEQAELIPNDALLRYAQQMNTTPAGYELVYDLAVTEFPEVFAAEAERFRNLLVEEQNMNAEDLAAVNDLDILWEEYRAYMQSGQVENMEELAAVLAAKYNVSIDEPASSEEPENALDAFKEAIVSETTITQGQLAAIGDETIESLVTTLGFDIEDLTAANVTSFEYALITYYPDQFTDEQINVVANQMRETAVSASPMTMDIANQIPSGDFLAWYRDAAATGGNDITYSFQRAVVDYRSLFTDLVVQAKSELMENTSLTQTVLDQMEFGDLLFATYAPEGQSVDYAAAEQRLRETYPSLFTDETATETEESESLETSESTESVSVTVSKSSAIESKPTTGEELPNTGESNPFWLISISLVLLAGAGYLIYRGSKQNKNS